MILFKTAALVLLASSTDAFAPLTRNVIASTQLDWRCSKTEIRSAVKSEEEKTLRKELADKNSAVKNEAQYGVADGANMQGLFNDSDVPETPPTSDRTSLVAKMERMMKPRAYPLFLAEKAAEILESTVEDLSHLGTSLGLAVGGNVASANTQGTKERVVILGTGWGAATYLKLIDNDLYDVTVISPRNYFLFTPMLAGSSVGTVEYRSITEPVREINHKADFLEAMATDIDPKTNTVMCQSVVCDGNSCAIEEFSVNYDKLIVTVGAQSNTFGIPGVREHCCFLRQVEDARKIRTAIVNCFERANIPTLTDEERLNNLTFAVIGAGPTGVEFAAELRDFVEQDGPKYYPKLLKFVRIKLIEASSTVLAPFDKSLQDEAIKQLKRTVSIKDPAVRNLIPENFELTELLLDCSVKEVKDTTILLNNGRELHYGIAVWAAGNGPLPITLRLIETLGEEQANEQKVARGRVAVDPWLRVVGGEGNILSFGDCSCITTGQLPATAQVASQQGEYLAGLMNKKYDLSPPLTGEGVLPPPARDPNRKGLSLAEAIAGFATQNWDYAKPFQFLNLGILAYTGGNSALAQVPLVPDSTTVKGSGQLGNAVWKSVYLTKQVSWRNRLLVLNDWTKRQMFGRDITRL